MMYVEKARIFEPVGYVSVAAKDVRQLLDHPNRALAE